MMAGFMPVRDYHLGHPQSFTALRAMCDRVIVLDDNSRVPFPYPELCHYVSLPRSGPWNDTANRTLGLHLAYLLNCRQVLMLDADMLPSRALLECAEQLAPQTEGIIYCGLRDLWGDLDHYRVDGRWGRKIFPIIYRNWFFDSPVRLPDFSVRLHRAVWPAGEQPPVALAGPECCVYHFGSLTAAARQARVAKYRVEDSQAEFQHGIGYDYLADETGLELAPVPPADRALFEKG